ncbi:MAG: helix-turn-helix transcriptional regulator [Thermoproteota archaeon]|nr:helix-turn-helix transcriptional regulator [Thermoproteota archaeon]
MKTKGEDSSMKSGSISNTCEVMSIWEVLDKRWALLILKNLSTKEVIRFNELKKTLSGISSTVLAERLLELEREGLVTKKIYPEIPPKVEYALTIRAKELEVILKCCTSISILKCQPCVEAAHFKEPARWANRWKSTGTSKTMPTIAVRKKPS